MAKLNAFTYASRDDAEQKHLLLIDEAANKARMIDSALAEIYLQKVDEARHGGGVLLQAEAEMLAIDVSVLCECVLQRHSERLAHIHDVEIGRIKAKSDVRNSESAQQMHTIYQNFKASIAVS